MRLRVRIISQRRNLDGIDFRVQDENGEEWIILNCLPKNMFYMFVGYIGAISEAKYSFNERHPAHLNHLTDGTWELLIE